MHPFTPFWVSLLLSPIASNGCQGPVPVGEHVLAIPDCGAKGGHTVVVVVQVFEGR